MQGRFSTARVIEMPAFAERATQSGGDRSGAKKKLVRRTGRDRSQLLRLGVQCAFVLLNVLIGIEFYLFVRFYEAGVFGIAPNRPAGVEGWLPIDGLMNLKLAILTGRIPPIHPAAMFLTGVAIASAFLFRKAFCSWICPVGTLSEYVWKLGRKLMKRTFQLPRWLDLGLRALKYVLLAFFVYAVVTMSAEAILSFQRSPYGLIADVRMLNFFRSLSSTAAIVLATLLVFSFFIQNFWCRYLCPYGALMGLASLLSPLRIRRNAETCIDCAKCAKACPSRLPVDQLVTICSAECIGCLECVAVCPAENTLFLSAPRKKMVPAWGVAAGLVILSAGTITYAKVSGHWNTPIPAEVYHYLIPHADDAVHPETGE